MTHEQMLKDLLETIIPIILGSFAGVAALLTAIFNRKLPKNDEIRARAEALRANSDRERISNETLDSEVQAAKLLAESAKELVTVAQSLMTTVERELTEYYKENKELKAEMVEIRKSSEECKKAIEGLKEENRTIISKSKKLLHGVGLLLEQLKKVDIAPVWTPPQDLLDTIDRRIKDLKEIEDSHVQS